MCTSPLIRYRAKKQDAGTFLASSSQWMIKSAKELQGYFKSYSAFYEYMNEYMDYQYIPCRRCDECKATYARDWSIRCYHEFMIRECASFVTLTIDSSKVHYFFDDMRKYCKRCIKGNRFIKYPIDYTLCKGMLQDELKRMRDVLYKRYGIKIRYFGCGEYGEKDERPHYHILIFGYDFPDKVFYKISGKGVNLYLSEELSKFWKYGLATIQDVNHKACMYTAKYCMKKLKFMDEQSEFEAYYGREPEFLIMSRGNCNAKRCKYIDDIVKNCKGMKSLRDLNNPYCKFCDKTRGGIGYDWLLKYVQDIIKIGYITIDGIKYPIPKYYLSVIKLTNLEWYDIYKINQLKFMDEKFEQHPEELSVERLEVRRQVVKSKVNHYNRA